jgi:hypothetical protein
MSVRSTKYIVGLLGVLTLLFIAVPAYWYQAVTASTGVEHTVASQLSEQLGRHVSLGAIRVKPTGSIIAENVIVDEKGAILLRAKEVRIGYNIWQLFSERPLDGLRSIEFYQPEIFLDRNETSGEWNIVRLFKDLKKPGKKAEIEARIQIAEGKAFIKDGKNSVQMDNIKANLYVDRNGQLTFQGAGDLDGQPIRAQGMYHIPQNVLGLQIDAEGQKLATWKRWIPQTPGIEINDGLLHISAFLWLEPYKPLQFSGELNLAGANFTETKHSYVISQAVGKILINDTSVYIENLAGKFNGESFTTFGNVSLDGRQPYLDLTVRSDGFNIHNALPDRAVPLDGEVQMDLRATGPVDNLLVKGTIELAAGVAQGISIENAKARLSYSNDWVEIQHLEAAVYGGMAYGQGVVKLGEQPIYSAHSRYVACMFSNCNRALYMGCSPSLTTPCP